MYYTGQIFCLARSEIYFSLSPRNTGSHRKIQDTKRSLNIRPKHPETFISPPKAIKKGSHRFGNFQVSFVLPKVCAFGIPTLALSKSGSRSKVLPSSQPVTQAPVSYSIFYIISLYNEDYNTF